MTLNSNTLRGSHLVGALVVVFGKRLQFLLDRTLVY